MDRSMDGESWSLLHNTGHCIPTCDTLVLVQKSRYHLHKLPANFIANVESSTILTEVCRWKPL